MWSGGATAPIPVAQNSAEEQEDENREQTHGGEPFVTCRLRGWETSRADR